MKIIAAIIFMLFGVFGSLKLKTSDVIGEPSFILILCITTLASLFIAFHDRIGSLSFRELKIEMAKVESARHDVEQRQMEVRLIATSLAEVTLFLAAFQHRIGSEESYADEVAWLKQKVTALLNNMKLPETEQRRIFHHLEAVQRLDSLKATDRAQAQAEWKELWKVIKSEIRDDAKTAA